MAEYQEPLYKIWKHVADLSTPNRQGVNSQINIISWGNDGKLWGPVVDIRKWSEDEDGNMVPHKGVVLRLDEFKQLLRVDTSDFEHIFTDYEKTKIQTNRQKNNIIHGVNKFNKKRHASEEY